MASAIIAKYCCSTGEGGVQFSCFTGIRWSRYCVVNQGWILCEPPLVGELPAYPRATLHCAVGDPLFPVSLTPSLSSFPFGLEAAFQGLCSLAVARSTARLPGRGAAGEGRGGPRSVLSRWAESRPWARQVRLNLGPSMAQVGSLTRTLAGGGLSHNHCLLV